MGAKHIINKETLDTPAAIAKAGNELDEKHADITNHLLYWQNELMEAKHAGLISSQKNRKFIGEDPY